MSKYLTDIIEDSFNKKYLIPIIDKEIKKQAKAVNFRVKGFHPSEVAGMCPRYVILKRLLGRFKQREVNINLHRIFNDGTMAHEWYQHRYLGPAGVLYGKWVCSRCKEIIEGFMPEDSCECQKFRTKNIENYIPDFCINRCFRTDYGKVYREQKLVDKRGGCVWCGQNNIKSWGKWEYKEPYIYDEELGLVGKSDGLVFLDNKWLVPEIKTINGAGWSNLKEPYEGHIAQAACYEYCFRNCGKEPYNKVEGRLFLYINKDKNTKIGDRYYKEKEFLVKWSERDDLVIDGILTMKKHWDNKELPPMDKNCPKIRRNKRCDFWDVCVSNGIGREGWKSVLNIHPWEK